MARRPSRQDDYEDDEDELEDEWEEEDEDEEEEDEDEEITAAPPPIMVASWIWIVTGSLVLLGALVALVAIVAGINEVPKDGPQGDMVSAYKLGSYIGLGLMALFAAVFIHVGIQSIQGLAKDTLGNGIGSLIFGLLQLAAGLVRAFAQKEDLVTVVFLVLAGFALIFAGILAIVARQPYLSFVRYVQKSKARKSKRRR